MDIVAGITVEGVIAVVGLVLGLRAEVRAHAERKHGQAAKRALACHRISEILEAGNAVTVADPVGLTQENQSAFTLAERVKQAIPPVVEAFPEIVVELEDLKRDAERLTILDWVPPQSDTAYSLMVDQYYRIYHNLLLLSYVAFHRYRRSERTVPGVSQDQFVQTVRERREAFRRERFSIRGLPPPP
jgi:hypothetical protein